ncbi:exopolysaccharide biosynthesis protein [Devosia naphthalenivorans]|uniref:exopolysaccharide biosynthesis protein n=1 Tax=Devosia naphthalenivorans TaxID=2082392 RepID=UPI0013B05427|nr:exopolysaccharide biosynthesis protein [Devosia naphthalenivorans]
MSPVEVQVAAIADNVSRAERVTAGELLALLGNASYPMVILVLSVLNMIPGPPGYGGTIALAIMAVTVTMLVGRPLRLGGWIGRLPLPGRLLERMIGQMRWLAQLIARVSRPRLGALTGPRSEYFLGIFILVVSLPMVLPIPFINAVPNTGIAVICVSRINRDGFGVLLGMLIAVIGLGIAGGAIWAAISLAQTVLAA